MAFTKFPPSSTSPSQLETSNPDLNIFSGLNRWQQQPFKISE